MPNRLCIYLVDDHAVLREGLQSLINAEPDLVVCGQAGNGATALQEIAAQPPDLVVMDISLPDLNGIKVTEKLKQRHPKLHIIALTQYSDQAYLRQILQAGAAGYVLKQTATEVLINAIRAVAAGGTFIDPALAGQLVNSYLGRKLPKDALPLAALTEREARVLELVAWGHTSKEIGEQFDISAKTVDSHKTRAMEKLGLKTRADIVRYASQQGWMQKQ
jgi:DNA-binding NarL/FixJ family response regulator